MTLVRNCYQHLRRLVNVLEGQDIWQETQIRRKRIVLGNARACWRVCPSGLSNESVVYSFGVGEDISFDLELIRRFGVRVHAFDPTPRSIQWVQTQALPEQFIFHPYGVAGYDGTCEFRPPQNPAHISHTVLDRPSPWPAIELPVYRLTTIMKRLGHRHVHLLKMDIEGAEYAVLDDILSCRIRMDQLLIEFHHRWAEVGIEKTKRAILELNDVGYRIFTVSPAGEEYGFLLCS
jgi:FkbM family methyltransferase